MAQATLHKHPSIENGYVIQTDKGTFELTDHFVKHSLIDTDGLDKLPWDISIQAMLDNAYSNSDGILTPYEILLLSILAQEKIEDFD
jgi:hypothetical protein